MFRWCKQCFGDLHWFASTCKRAFVVCTIYTLLCPCFELGYCGHHDQEENSEGLFWNIAKFVCLHRDFHETTCIIYKKPNSKKDKDGKQREYFLKKLSDTRWACRADSIKAIHHTLEAVLDTLEDIKDNKTNANIAAEAKGLFNNIDFEFVLALEVKYVENTFKL